MAVLVAQEDNFAVANYVGVRPFIVAFDLDDVLFGCVEALCTWYNREYPQYEAISPETFIEWDMSKYTPLGHDIYSFFKQDFYADAQPVEGAVWLLSKLKKRGDRVLIVTSTFHKEGALRFVETHFKGLFDGFIHIWDGAKKSDVFADFLIDDKPENLRGGVWVPVLYSRPRNAAFDSGAERMHRVDSMYELAHFLNV